MTSSRYAVGIDLGTTHTVLAYADRGAEVEIFRIPQLVAPSEIDALPLLASALYAPVASEHLADPWSEAPFAVGAYARARGAEVPGRSVLSAKSWLSHAGVDRDAPILPWGAEEEPGLVRISPVEASATYLRHVKKTWDGAFPAHPLAAQDVVLTVPASFDPSARELTALAAERAGLRVHLLEEPQAAFYDFMHDSPERLVALREGAQDDHETHVLVCDVGGGTTDLSLMGISAGTLGHVRRVAVGHHLLLGGDNMDLALAHLCEPRLTSEKLAPARMNQLVAVCRVAKERLLGRGAPESHPVTMLSAGSQLVGASRSTVLAKDEVRALLLDGFFPIVQQGDFAQPRRSALSFVGLPYERDVAITRHVAGFLRRHLPQGPPPRAALLNGGVFRAEAIAERLHAALLAFTGAPIEMWHQRDPDLAVARGAVLYALAKREGSRGTRIESHSARGYYIGLDAPRAGEARRAVSLVPRGAREGEWHRAAGRTFALTVGRPARFDVFACDDARIDPPGSVVTLDEENFVALPPVAVRFDDGREKPREITVEIAGDLSPVGTLDLACEERDANPPKRYRLTFELRGPRPMTSAPPPQGSRSAPPGSTKRADATQAIDDVFGKGSAEEPRLAKNLVRELERLLGERATWDGALCRALFDDIMQRRAGRRRSVDHERVFFLLAGYTIRPGFGDPGDPVRVAPFTRLFSEFLAFPEEVRSWEQFWIAGRRVSAGLDETLQESLRNEVDPFLAPAEKKLKKRKGVKPLAPFLMLEMASSLERVPTARRTEFGEWILERTWTDRDRRLFLALGRVGARVPAYASLHHVIAPQVAERWLDHLLRDKWEQLPEAAEAAVALARMTGDRARDVSQEVRARVEAKLERSHPEKELLRAVREVVEPQEKERTGFLGESLPLGLRLID